MWALEVALGAWLRRCRSLVTTGDEGRVLRLERWRGLGEVGEAEAVGALANAEVERRRRGKEKQGKGSHRGASR